MGLFDQVGGALGSVLRGMGGEQAGLVGGVLDLLKNESSDGGLSGVVQAFQKSGLGDIVASWVGTGANLPVSAGQIQQVLGDERLRQLAQRVGVSPDGLAAKLAAILPGAIDQLTPDGKLPEAGLLGAAMNLLKGARS